MSEELFWEMLKIIAIALGIAFGIKAGLGGKKKEREEKDES